MTYLMVMPFTLPFTPTPTLAQSIVLSLSFLSFVWATVSILQVNIRCRRIGFRRSNLTRLLSGPRPTEPSELVIWQWVLEVCCAILMLVLCMFALPFIS